MTPPAYRHHTHIRHMLSVRLRLSLRVRGAGPDQGLVANICVIIRVTANVHQGWLTGALSLISGHTPSETQYVTENLNLILLKTRTVA